MCCCTSQDFAGGSLIVTAFHLEHLLSVVYLPVQSSATRKINELLRSSKTTRINTQVAATAVTIISTFQLFPFPFTVVSVSVCVTVPKTLSLDLDFFLSCQLPSFESIMQRSCSSNLGALAAYLCSSGPRLH